MIENAELSTIVEILRDYLSVLTIVFIVLSTIVEIKRDYLL